MSKKKTINLELCLPVSVLVTAALTDDDESFDIFKIELSAFQHKITKRTLSDHCSVDDFVEIRRLLKES